MLENVFCLGVLILFAFIAFSLFTIPISIGEARGLPPASMKRIRLCTWGGLLTGVLWFIALVLALTEKRNSRTR